MVTDLVWYYTEDNYIKCNVGGCVGHHLKNKTNEELNRHKPPEPKEEALNPFPEREAEPKEREENQPQEMDKSDIFQVVGFPDSQCSIRPFESSTDVPFVQSSVFKRFDSNGSLLSDDHGCLPKKLVDKVDHKVLFDKVKVLPDDLRAATIIPWSDFSFDEREEDLLQVLKGKIKYQGEW
eukprot:CAMPEP_0174266304 /NCGR_PEP_ID=MMETSP0439-20130205/29657_1 /TAXON_ID=0 /ORGANISM="Stereomyxa ramosa, Strain Chinc5" /LENGTH=179 /DNA_ID=CAMNT_0015353189 /DNA_START=486 /DNA_END=1022 /DNA_ORIENTATION=-